MPLAWTKWLAGAFLAATFILSAASGADAQTRSLKLHFIHTGEKAEITYMRNGRYIQSGLNEINRFLRDWRRNEPAKMDPRLLDLVHEVYRASGSRAYITVVSAYRSPATNSMLRSRSSGVAQNSQHMLGKAMDFYLPDVKLSRLRELGLKMEVGGVGYYPRSGSPFVHLDVGNVRHWPRMSRRELMAVFPNGQTIHTPSDGKPLPGYQVALANYEKRKRSGGSIQIARESSRGGGLLAGLFGGGADEEEDNAESTVAAAPRRQPAAPARPQPQEALPGVPAAAPPAQAAPEPIETPAVAVASLPARMAAPAFAPRPSEPIPAQPADAPVAVASVAPQLPESLPFGIGPSTPEPSSPALEMALNVPLPTARPDPEGMVAVASAAEGQPTPEEEKLLVALAQQRPAGPAAFANDAQPSTLDTVAAYAPTPETRPTFPAEGRGPRPTLAAMAEIPVTRRLAPAVADDTQVIAAVQPASPRVAMLSAEEGPDRLRRVAFGAKTTAKAARPTAGDSRPEARSVSIPLPQNITRWALDHQYVVSPKTATERAAAYEAVREAPKVVYMAGFQQGQPEDPSRFSGKAVTFMPVAKFQSN